MDDAMILLGMRVRKLRKEHLMTQGELAQASGVGVKYLSRIERGDTNVTIKLASQLAQALNVSICELLQAKQEHGRESMEMDLFKMIKNSPDEKLRLLHGVAQLIHSD